MRVEETFAVSSLYFKCQQLCLLSFPFSLYPARDNFTISTYSFSWAQGTREEIERQLSLPHYDLLFSYLPEKPLIERHSLLLRTEPCIYRKYLMIKFKKVLSSENQFYSDFKLNKLVLKQSI